MAHIDLRDLTTDDRDAAYTAFRASASSWPHVGLDDRAAFDAWADVHGDDVRAVAEDGLVVGVAAVLDVAGDREILIAVSPDAGDDAATEALRLLTVHEAERPLYACISPDDDPSHAMLARIGFVEHGRDGADIVYVLPPTLE
ncbi:GNAT family N-acetyltransferase [Microbacterium trichothecenolyticum]|uniref:RimJ/RimL family protein N-acetyltransferase n=1 Tax=Microbacterium trichothecenolyticum TaxID=69370 RepID=A0ABU0TW74_MICTR|nr:GNAT family N-acetyltransferase [Microbacterium trichothecenolyticum]MDQ1123913.1 RimJ/RimL family protein N-acetyltransferase [Microbacterium trichothecenolyticum]